jgi:hypothetical protein
VLHSVKDLNHFNIQSVDGEIGKVEDCYFDDEKWTVRYLVVRTGSWLTAKKVLISPVSIRNVNWDIKSVEVFLTKEQVGNSPNIDTEKPISRQMEEQYFDYYRWPYYWTGAGIWGIGPYPSSLGRNYPMGVPTGSYLKTEEVHPELGESKREEPHGDPHLRSVREVSGYKIAALDSDFGHIENMIFEDQSWSIRYLVIDTKNWWPSKSVLLAPEWVNSISWLDRKFRIDLESEAIKNSPEYRPDEPILREYEDQLYDYYGRKKYWAEDENKLSGFQRAAKKPKRYII